MIRVLLVDDQRLVRAGLRMLCESAGDLLVVGEAAGGHEAVRLVEREVPDVVLMDLWMPGMDGITATERVLGLRPGTRVLVLTTFDDDEHLYRALAAGACGFLVKDAAPADLLDAVRRAAGGDSPFSPGVLRRLVGQAVRSHTTGPEPEPLPALTDREREVLALVGAGLSNGEIAERLHLGVTTVKTHVANLMTKTGSDNRVRLAVLAVRAGL
ncbi:DNA-binding response regulator, NarL/FixJ family, contains REC and HTH domains [Amycolatopsis arida]|uniref:DNA-binding response regulator, NarL/FixJ family, contains REC and HTH domains n=1 Tax=Amycolatopsis arida TaxID=587909 RepID=A0A1I6AL09_9PSEU|nr:response regulator transcription factor [Amycolatopsis arida]TDX87367.1 DNA-binding NarL/FixJ family response regulator [Amycolatopsis arida]SFQ69418.1 DNA-binding response regulator, NarL/FixJ family, contains REC and HTH domains [Amycolatopsis arida]